jgi:hypothetical protein
MFNLSKHNSEGTNNVNNDILSNELDIFGIVKTPSGQFEVEIGDETLKCNSVQECNSLIEEGLKELKDSIWDKWQDLEAISNLIVNSDGGNAGGLDNLLFLYNVKSAYWLSSLFTDLENIKKSIYSLFNIDIADASDILISKFNKIYIQIKVIHRLIMREMYRLDLVKKYMQMNKSAQSVSGPWANLDLPMNERVWEWDSGETEYFENRTKERRAQKRYNPENNSQGFYYVWPEPASRDPYLFSNMSTDSPYHSMLRMTVP